VDAGDHRLLIGRVERMRYDTGGSPLLFVGGRFFEP
jgi:flavin reductase (DIM6/NTAB) family NADH-FMN oxidoreductase RutF